MKRTGKEKNPYLKAFYKKNNISIGREFPVYEYMFWIDKKHDEFRKMHGIAEHRELNEKEVVVFCEYINA